MNRPGKIVCVGRNYRDHAKEMGNDVPTEPLIFLKPPSSVIANGDAIVLPPQSSQVEHEGEIGVVIGRTLRRVSSEEARDGDSEHRGRERRDCPRLATSDSQWTRAKGFDTFCPLGEPASPPADLDRAHRGHPRQRRRAPAREGQSDMVFSIPDVLAYISHVMTLEPGDLVLDGKSGRRGETLAPGTR